MHCTAETFLLARTTGYFLTAVTPNIKFNSNYKHRTLRHPDSLFQNYKHSLRVSGAKNLHFFAPLIDKVQPIAYVLMVLSPLEVYLN